MNYIKLSIKELEEKSIDWAINIKRDYEADLIIYVAKAGYLIAKSMASIIKALLFQNVPYLLEIF